MSTNYAQGTPCWIDIGTPDLDAAIAFYSDLFGWEIEKGLAEMGHYSMAQSMRVRVGCPHCLLRRASGPHQRKDRVHHARRRL